MNRNQLLTILGLALAVGGAYITLRGGSADSSTTVILVCRDPAAPGLHPGATGARIAEPIGCPGPGDAGLLPAAECLNLLLQDAGIASDPFVPGCWAVACPDAGLFSDLCRPDAGARVGSSCVVPNCWLSDGDGGFAWTDNATGVDCNHRFDGGAVWGGCNVMPAVEAVGSACIPSECTIPAGAGVEAL